jgi:hypothetical protein
MSGPENLPVAHVVHAVPGRTRLIVPARRGIADFFERATTALRRMEGVVAATASPRAGSLVVRHAGHFGSVAAAARAAGLFVVAPLPAPRLHLSPARVQPGRRPVPPLLLAAAGLAGLSVLQVMRGRGAGSAVEALWNAYQARSQLGMPKLAGVLMGVGLWQLARGEILGSGLSMLVYALSARQSARQQDGGRG